MGFELMINRDMKTTLQKVNTLGACFLSRSYSRVELGGHVLTIVNGQFSPPPPTSHSLIFVNYKVVLQTFVFAIFSCLHTSSRAFVVALGNFQCLLLLAHGATVKLSKL